MEDTTNTIYFFCTFLLCVCHLQYFCSGRDSIISNQWIYDNITDEGIVSPGNIFQLGFFTPNGTTASKGGRYVGIWYCNSPEVIVWVANRKVPIPVNESGKFGIDASGNLKVCGLYKNNCTYFSTPIDPTPIDLSRSQQNYLAKLDDTGNLVLADARTHATMWESFEYPTDTFLPGMKMDKYLNLTSWIGADNPAPGNFSFRLDEGVGGGYLITKLGVGTYWSWGESNNKFIHKQMSFPPAGLLANTPHTSLEVNNSRLSIRSDGEILYWSSNPNKTKWSPIWSEPEGPCSIYNACGPSSICKPDSKNQSVGVCKCLPGFESTNKKEYWDSSEFSGGCKKKSSECTHDNTTEFVPLNVTMVRSNSPFFLEESLIVDAENISCPFLCQKNCSCQAYSFHTTRETKYKNDSAGDSAGCWFWYNDLHDVQEESTSNDTEPVVIYLRGDPHGLPRLSAGNQARKYRISSNLKGVIISTSVIFAVALLCCILCISYRRVMAERKDRNFKEKSAHQFNDNEADEFQEDDKKDIDVPFFELESILAATDNFSQEYKLGQGGFGPVYKGKFTGGEEIAVKRLSSTSGQGLNEFKNEVMLIAKLQHRNLVRLLGYCIKGNEKILLYEYMPNRSLDAFIFDEKLRVLLNWEARFGIIIGVARGLLYLHQDSRLRVIHRDMKASNILLDEEMNPKISDFGLARIVGHRETESNTSRVIGTYGYMAPEYALEGQFSVKSDAFSFGVVVLEIISGKKNTGFYDSQLALNLLGYAWNLWNEDKSMTLLDETLLGSCNNSEVLKCITVGLLCVQEDPNDRPNMSKVVFMLSSEAETLPKPKQPAFVTRKHFADTTSSSKLESKSQNEITISEVDAR